MNILIVGAGGREHAFAWKLKQSKHCGNLFIAPGNTGTALCGTNLPIAISDFDKMADACKTHSIDLILVGPEEPLVKGIYDYFKNNNATKHIAVIGPSQAAAQLEGSKAFAKSFMQKHNVPTAAYKEFSSGNYEEGIAYLKNHTLPIVLKADGLAAGKGVLICNSVMEAISEFDLMINQSKFGEAGKIVVVEEFLKGIELSVFVLTDGEEYLVLPEAKDYKRIGEGDTGLNTGGMGAVSPVPFADAQFIEKVVKNIIAPTIAGFKKDNLEYTGFVFIGLMNDNGEPKVIEYNCRMGDPEAEVVMLRTKNDLVELLMAASQKRLHEIKIDIENRAAAAIVAASNGYPGEYKKGLPIIGLSNCELDGSYVFHAGTMQSGNTIVTNGGRVLVVSSLGDSIKEAVNQSNYVMEQIYFDGLTYRTDIGYEFEY